MVFVMALFVGLTYATAFYFLLARSSIRLIFGLLLLGHAANMLILLAGGITRAAPAIVPPGAVAPPSGHADPIPQALVLTAIVISFAVLAFTAVLVKRAYVAHATDDTEALSVPET